ncbi:adenylate/guanylate cyclase domain-containing protein [Leptospira perdikensis]|uniref:Adenylate/guanylate cyclase domain-containing protein n=1 Tax=Leptospira perdikensis TaxID=2484948 RepID=A0A4R9JCW2_9LEPT|nr:adenylate/guanylate cyclase domain-containing protein [Leptospira perdikensis]TGL35941.1 adenylate/guanylate cyclase domain-containing protein [Leptospira perdikensis]
MKAVDLDSLASVSKSADISLADPIRLYILFIDLCGSTDFKTYCLGNQIPDGIWIERQLIYLHRIINIVERFKGSIVKTIGDEVMAYFTEEISSDSVIRCATDSHSLFRDIARYDNKTWQLKSKISIDFGYVYNSNFGLLKEGIIDPIGLVVDRCSRINGESKPDQVLLSSSVFAKLSSESQEKYSKFKELINLKGVGESEIYRLKIE